MSKLSELKKNRAQNLKSLQEKLEQSSNNAPKDERIWKPSFDKDKGKGTAIVRFLTPVTGDPFVEKKTYSFVGPGGNYYDIARDTIGEDDPIKIAAITGFRKAKATEDMALKEECKKFLPKSNYFANVLIIKDEAVPGNEGQVKIFQFGRQIYTFMSKALKPEFDDIEAIDPFDFWEGANFRIRMVGSEIPDSRTRKNIVVPNYEQSSFDPISSLFDGDEEKIDEVYNKTYDLSEFVNPSKIKSFEEVAKRFEEVVGKPYNWLLDSHETTPEIEESKTEDPPKLKSSDPDPHVEDEMDDDDPMAKFLKLSKSM